MEKKLVDHEKLELFVRRLYEKAGMPVFDASYCAECTVKSNLWGVDSHGILRTPIYIKRLLNGAVNSRPKMQILCGEQKALTLCDGDAGHGYIVGRYGMDLAIANAQIHGIAMVVVKNSNHFGVASLYTRRASEKGLIGIVASNAFAIMGVDGALGSCLGNNPIAFSAPLNDEYPFSLDISLSEVSLGKILLASKSNETIPKHWARDADGNETDDPDRGYNGYLLPMGMHKGFGLALFVDIITGVISNGGYLGDIKSIYRNPEEPSDTSHMFAVVDPSVFMEKSVFINRMKEWEERVRKSPMKENQPLIIPGEKSWVTYKSRSMNGIPIQDSLLKELQELSDQLKIRIPF